MADEPLFGIPAVPVDWPVLRQDLRIVEVHMVFGTYGMQIVDVQLRSNGAWFVIRVLARSMNFSGYELFNSSE